MGSLSLPSLNAIPFGHDAIVPLRTIEAALVGAATMAQQPLGGLVEIVRQGGGIGHVGKHGAQLRQAAAGVGPLRPAAEAMDGGLEEPLVAWPALLTRQVLPRVGQQVPWACA